MRKLRTAAKARSLCSITVDPSGASEPVKFPLECSSLLWPAALCSECHGGARTAGGSSANYVDWQETEDLCYQDAR